MSEPCPPLRVLLLSAVGTNTNPYIGLLRDGLAAAGAEVRLIANLDSAVLAAFRPDVIHLHWLERYDLPRPITAASLHDAPDLPRQALRRITERTANAAAIYAWRRRLHLQGLFGQLRAFQARGGRVAYTIHNVDPHEEVGAVERWGTAQMLALADLLHVHDAGTAALVATRFERQQGIVIVPHGHYLGCYPNTISRDEARAALSLSADAFVFACLGLLRPYKGLEELLPVFRSLPERDLCLLLAGKPGSKSYLNSLQILSTGDDRIRLEPRFLHPEEVQVYLNAADVCVLPYRQITMSGAALLAFSFGLPVIAPALGAFPNLVRDRRGLLYDPAERGALPRALVQARHTDWSGAREEIMTWVAQFDWVEIGRNLLAAYRS